MKRASRGKTNITGAGSDGVVRVRPVLPTLYHQSPAIKQMFDALQQVQDGLDPGDDVEMNLSPILTICLRVVSGVRLTRNGIR